MRRRAIAAMMGACLGALAGCASEPPPEPPVPQPRPEPPARRPAAPPPAADLRPEQLAGLDQAQAQALLGSPTARSTRAMATVWSYRRGRCVVSLVFYPEVGTAVERVLDTEVEGGSAADCLRRLRQERIHHGQ